MKTRLMAAILATLVATASAAQHSMSDATFTEQAYATAFTGQADQFPIPLNQAQMDETKGEWGFILIRIAGIIAGAVIRAPTPAHAPTPPEAGPCQNRGRNITCY